MGPNSLAVGSWIIAVWSVTVALGLLSADLFLQRIPGLSCDWHLEARTFHGLTRWRARVFDEACVSMELSDWHRACGVEHCSCA